MGTFKAHDGEYFLEPLIEYVDEEHEDEQSKPHLLYKKQQKLGEPSGKSGPNCEITGTVTL